MSGVKVTEDTFTLPDGVSVYRRTWTPSKPVATLIVIHGFSDHINRYNTLCQTLAKSHSILCTGIDQRGWGRSVTKPTDKGNAGPTSLVLSDLAALIQSYLSSSKTPIFALGHSMGGAELLTLASTPQYKDLVSQLSGILLESPYIALPPATAPSYIKLLLGRAASYLFPKTQIVNKIPIEAVVTDPKIQQEIEDDPLCHATGTLEMFANMIDRAADLVSGKLVLNDGVKAMWLAHGSGDEVTCCEASREWFEREGVKVKDGEWKVYEGWSHELHVDTPENGKIFARDVGDWIAKRVPK